jgi:DNA-binding CsgD family transcriptional regulator/tetratricopeptide (TPR) repeat protein
VYWGACEHLSTPEPLLPLRDIARASGEGFDPGADHFASFEKLLRILAGDGVPSLLVLEDVHWADAATLDLIRFLGRRVGRLRTLVLITYRDEEAGARSPLRHMLGEAPAGSVERMTLEPLSRWAVSQLAERAGRNGGDLFALTGGNPFLVTEALAIEGDAPPESVRDATIARAARLTAAGRGLLEAVSIFPRHADTAMAASLVEGGIDAGLDDCVDKGMLTIDSGTLKFRHELARRAVEGSLPASRRRSLHQKVVDILQESPGARASEIAHHAERAGDIPALIEFARRAGEEAARANAFREAAAHYAAMLRHRHALDLAATIEALERHGWQSYLMGAVEVARTSMTEAAQLRRRAKDAIGLGRNLTQLTRISLVCGQRADAEQCVQEAIEVLSAASAGRELAWAFSHKSQLDMLAFKHDSAIEWGQRALELAERLGEQEIIIHALGNVGTSRAHLGDDRSEDLERSFQLAKAAELHDHAARASCNLTCNAYWHRNHPDALRHIERGASYAAERDLIHWEAYLRGWRAMVRIDRGDWRDAEREAEEVSGWAGTPLMFRFPAHIALARLRARRGDQDAETPLDAVRQIIATVSEMQRSIYLAVVDAELAWLNRAVLAPDCEGRNRAEDPVVEAVVTRLRELHEQAVLHDSGWVAEDAALWLHLLGEPVASTARLSGPFRDHCEGRWRAAAGGWHVLGFPYEKAIALSEGDEDAQREALTIFDRLGAAPAAARLRRVMRARGVRAVPRGPIAGTRANPAGLTRRQSQVLVLVSEGLSNSEIAERLCISAKTAEHHVSALMARLETTTRREAASEARKRGLLGDDRK